MSDPAPSDGLKVILLTQWFEPEPTFKGKTFAKALQSLGHDVSVVTGFPNYPGGKLYLGYKLNLYADEVEDNVHIKRLFLYPSHDGNAVGRALNYISFFLSVLVYLVFFAPRVDVIYVYHPPATVGLAAALARMIRRTPTVLDVQDMWPDTLVATGMIKHGFIFRVIGRICSFVYAHVDHIVVLSKGFKLLLQKRGVDETRLTVIPNWADTRPIGAQTVIADALKSYGGFKVLFAGNMGRAQGLETVIDAAVLLNKTPYEVRVFLLGSGVETDALKKRCVELQLKNIAFLPRVSMAEVGDYLEAADCLLVHLKADPLFAITIPSKTQAYLAAGKPIIMAVEGDAADMVKEAHAGFCIAPESAQDLANAMIKLSQLSAIERSNMGQSGKIFYVNNLSLDVGVLAFEKVFKSVVRRPASFQGEAKLS